MATVYVDSAAAGLNNGTSWTNAYTTLSAAVAASAAGTDYLIDDGHVEGHTGTDLTLAFSGTSGTPDTLTSVDKADDSYSRGALVNINAAGLKIEFQGFLRAAGIVIRNGNAGSNASSDIFLADNANNVQHYIDCDIDMNDSNSGANCFFGNNNCKVLLENCNYDTLGSNYIFGFRSHARWLGGVIMASAVDPARGFAASTSASTLIVEGFDFTEWGTSWDIYLQSSGVFNPLHLINCKFASGWAGDVISSTLDEPDIIILENCGDGDINYGYTKDTYAGTVTDQVDLYANGSVGGKHNTVDVPISYKMVSNASCEPIVHILDSPYIGVYNESTASQTVTWEFIHNETANLQNDEIWMRLQYLGTSASQKSTFKDTSSFDRFGTFNPYATATDVTTSTKAWDGGLTERENSTVYVAGDFVKSANSAGSAFICTVGGTSDSSEPAGFTGATDGDSITDNTVTWKAMRRQKMSVTITAAEQGVIDVNVIIAKASQTVWIANRLEVS